MVKKGVALQKGKRKNAVARAMVVKGTGKVTINAKPLDIWADEFSRMRVREPLTLAEDLASGVDIFVTVKGGGMTGQSDSARMAVARSLVEYYKDKNLKKKFIDYDRNMMVFDFRRNEPHHSSGKGCSKRGSRRHKQRSKR